MQIRVGDVGSPSSAGRICSQALYGRRLVKGAGVVCRSLICARVCVELGKSAGSDYMAGLFKGGRPVNQSANSNSLNRTAGGRSRVSNNQTRQCFFVEDGSGSLLRMEVGSDGEGPNDGRCIC